ncbi:MAG: hypothetical protein QXT53_07230 [Ignisphaera sp.]
MRVAVIKLTSCSGCINEIVKVVALDPKLLDIYEFVYFNEITDSVENVSKYDIVFVEGSITTKEQEDMVKMFRGLTDFMVAIGACAIHGGVQALRVGENIEAVKAYVYPDPKLIEVESDVKPVAYATKIDFYIPGCPVRGDAVKSLLEKFARGGLPTPILESVCGECKRRGIQCLVVSHGISCLGPITISGCGAICPSFRRGCYGCYGLRGFDETLTNVGNYIGLLGRLGLGKEIVDYLLRAFSFKEFSKLIKAFEK